MPQQKTVPQATSTVLVTLRKQKKTRNSIDVLSKQTKYPTLAMQNQVTNCCMSDVLPLSPKMAVVVVVVVVVVAASDTEHIVMPYDLIQIVFSDCHYYRMNQHKTCAILKCEPL